jgi:RimJ/RimL family protein N-acetyltransferase
MFAHLPVVRMQLDLKSCGVRSFRDADAAVLARHANNRKVWQQLRDRFPHPYTTDDACGFITFARGADPETAFAVTVGDLPVGSIGAVLREDVERCSAEVGYWLGEAYWGRGIATRALVAFTRFAFAAYGVERLFAVPLAANAACWRRPATGWRAAMRRSAVKDGAVQDQLLYAIVRGDGSGSG